MHTENIANTFRSYKTHNNHIGKHKTNVRATWETHKNTHTRTHWRTKKKHQRSVSETPGKSKKAHKGKTYEQHWKAYKVHRSNLQKYNKNENTHLSSTAKAWEQTHRSSIGERGGKYKKSIEAT